MSSKRLFLTLASAAALAAVGMYPVAVFNWFAQTFEQFADGTFFRGEDAVGGRWDAIPSGIATVSTVGGRKCIDVDSSKTDSGEIQFVATNALSDIVRVDFSICSAPLPRAPLLNERTDKGGLCLTSTNQVGVLGFSGYVAGGWTNLYGRGLVQRTVDWLDCRAEFDYTAGKPYVTYYQCFDGQYMQLTDLNGVSRFPAPGTEKVTAVAFRGHGYVGDFSGFGLAKDDERYVTWKGGETGDWNVPGNWDKNRVPGADDIAVIKGNVSIDCKDEMGDFEIVTHGATHELTYDGKSVLRIGTGDVTLNGYSGTAIADPGTTLHTYDTIAGIEMGYGSTLALGGALTVTKQPLYLDGVNLMMEYSLLSSNEAVVVITAPYGSGGIPATLKDDSGEPIDSWAPGWHGRPDGSSTLWLVNQKFPQRDWVARWKDGAWGRLLLGENWGVVKPSAENAAWIGDGRAHLNDGEHFPFTRRFEIGADTNGTGEVSMSGGTVADSVKGSVIVGTSGGTGLLDVVGGTVKLHDYLWNSALTVGADTNATGTVKVGVESSVDSRLLAEDGGISVGDGGSASMEIGRGKRIIGEVSAGGPVAVGYDGALVVSGGRLIGRDSFYIGRTARESAYDVSMTVNGGCVSNLSDSAGAFWVGSYGGLGSKAVMTIFDGEVFVTNKLVCGGYRSAEVSVEGGSLVAPEIRIGHALIDESDYATFSLVSGRVTTAGFTSGTNGVRTVELGGGRIVATAANEDFFAGIEAVRLAGETVLENAGDIVIHSALTGAGGLYKTGTGKTTVTGYVAWSGPTVVEQGVLDMAGGMIMGELAYGEDARVVNAKFDDIDALELERVSDWDGKTTTTSPYLFVQLDIAVAATNSASVYDADGIKKGAISFEGRGKTLSFAGWTALGWEHLNFLDGSPLTNDSYSVQMKFDFTEGKPYVIYYVKNGGTYERLVSDDGLTVFPVAGGLSATTFAGVGVTNVQGWQMNVAEGKVFYWTGAAGDDAWANAGNWSHDRFGGAAADNYPKDASETAYVENPSTIRLSSGCAVGSLVVNAPLTLSNDGLTVWKGVSGAGVLKLGGATIVAAEGASSTMNAAIEILVGTQNEIDGDVTVYGSLRGSGSLSASAKFYGDTQEFDGQMTLVDGSICSAGAMRNARSLWNVSGAPFAVAGATYEFGALDGTFSEAQDVMLVVGARDVDCRIDGSADGRSGVDWIAKTAALGFSVTNVAYLKLSGGGRVVIESSDSVPALISFVSDGGELSFATGVDADVSPALEDSSAPIVFNDGGRNRVWAAALSQSNSGGFVKRGKGTLKWLKAPETTMDVTVEQGVLEVPFGTRLGRVVVFNGAAIVVDLTGAVQDEIAFSAFSSDRPFTDDRLKLVNCPVGYEYNVVRDKNNGVVVANGSLNYVWNSAVGDGWWSATENWLVGGMVPDRPPQTNDTVMFVREACTTVRLDVAASVLKMTGTGPLHFVSNSLATALSVDLSRNDISLDGVALKCDGEFNARSVFGRGSVTVSSGILCVAPPKNRLDEFVGTLNVTNLVKNGNGSYRYGSPDAFEGTIDIQRGTFLWDCSAAGMTNQPSARIQMTAGSDSDTILDLCEQTVMVGSFTGSGTVRNGILLTADGKVTQSGGRLSIPVVANTVYYASRSDEKLELLPYEGMDMGIAVEIVVPRTWFAAGASGRRAIYCNLKEDNIIWSRYQGKSEGDGWWSIQGGGFTVRIR